MRGNELARQWLIVRAIEASPNGFTVTEIAQREETGIRTIYRNLEALRAAGFPLYTERIEKANRRALIDTFKSKILPPFIPTELMSLYFHKGLFRKTLVEPLPQSPVIPGAIDLMRKSRLYDLGRP